MKKYKKYLITSAIFESIIIKIEDIDKELCPNIKDDEEYIKEFMNKTFPYEDDYKIELLSDVKTILTIKYE
jgi:hypothetical protein